MAQLLWPALWGFRHSGALSFRGLWTVGVHAAGENCPGPSLGLSAWPMRRTAADITRNPAIMMTAVAMMLRKRLAILTTVCVFVPQPAIGSGSSPVAKSR